MKKVYKPASRVHKMLHGADYFPEQWVNYPEILEEDIRLMKLSKSNVMSIGMFAWGKLEPEEGVFDFKWLDHVLDRFAENEIYCFLATPSGARPAWMSENYPEVLRVGANRVRNLHGKRHNHCYTSPVYRERISIINQKLAERYAHHPAVIGWHVSNEYGGDCHCDHCQTAFRNWVKEKYKTLEELNHAWWATFWAHNISNWSQVESPAPHGETAVHAMNLDWKRFVTDQTIDFYKHEIEPLKRANPDLPAFTNFMEVKNFDGLDYFKLAKELDFVSWDAYPTWHDIQDEGDVASLFAFNHDLFRSAKEGQPFLLMESTPSLTNWQPVSKLKRPNMHYLSAMQAIAHGSDSVQYFQWRKSRGSSEKFHGAVVDHSGHENTRVFNEVSQVGDTLSKLKDIVGTRTEAEVALVFDTENRWAVEDAEGPRNSGLHYIETIGEHYKAFWEQGISVDVIDMEKNLEKYKVVVAPMLYLVKPGFGEKVEKFVENGGTFITTYWSGIVNENDLVNLGGFPGPLRKVLGIWSEELDGLYDGETNSIILDEGNSLGLSGEYIAHELCDLIHLEGAKALAHYADDFYVGRPALTVNNFGKGKAYYIASRNKDEFHLDFYAKVVDESGVKRVIADPLPNGVTAQYRTDGEFDYVFVMNFSEEDKDVQLTEAEYMDFLEETSAPNELRLPAFGVKLLKRKAK